MLNSTKFELPEKGLGNLQSIAIVLIWLLIEVLGNALLIGLIQFERLGGDPLKRRITDQQGMSIQYYWYFQYFQNGIGYWYFQYF